MPAIQINRSPSRNELLVFGVVLLVFFAIVGGIAWWHSAAGPARGLWVTGALLAAVFYAVPPLRLPLYLAWMHAVAPLGWLVSHAVLAVIYFGIITPMGVVMRLFGRDTMRSRFEPDADSYWTEHDPGGDLARYLKQS
jgi:hypothetical protein